MDITIADGDFFSQAEGIFQHAEQTENCSDVNDILLRNKKKKKMVLILAVAALAMYKIPMLPNRCRNRHRDRDSALVFVESWEDEYFQRQMRLCREDFNLVVRLITPKIEKKKKQRLKQALGQQSTHICEC